MNKLIAIVGETASGKSSLGMEIARMYKGEIIAADSRTIYKHFDVGSAKPPQEDRAEIPHHLLDIRTPDQRFTAAEFKELCNNSIEDIQSRGKLPIMVGGTGLYIDAVLFDFSFADKANSELRAELESLSDNTLIDRAEAMNPEGINLKNRRHVIRFIETGGTPKEKHVLRDNTLVIGLQRSKNEMRKRITKRVEIMFRLGLRKEIEALVGQYGWDNYAIDGEIARLFKAHQNDGMSMMEVKRRFVTKDMQYAKRQRTWFKRNANIQWFESSEDALKAVEQFMLK